ncbi:hypothetical protein M0R89_03575 [Halorussus limi]|uniref:Uncharacterized protein n=1 Tax=Halorussus limi TaxID=2938695 RepID=A0A8U0HVL0_9EURY|nr:hypothetical protein [Halorussus limi]UPV75155.1 hypothetical protein M0R89_03575 [Halorussus limi]
MTDENEPNTTNRRRVLKTIGATGLAASGLAAVSGSAAAQQSGNKNPITYNPNEYTLDGGEGVGALKVSLDSVDEEAGTASGTVSGKYRGEKGVEKFEESFSGVPISVEPVNSGAAFGGGGAAAMQQQTLIFLDLGPITLNVLGLIVETNRIQVRVSCDPSKGLLGQLLCGLLR